MGATGLERMQKTAKKLHFLNRAAANPAAFRPKQPDPQPQPAVQ
jgi:hypothetical protein